MDASERRWRGVPTDSCSPFRRDERDISHLHRKGVRNLGIARTTGCKPQQIQEFTADFAMWISCSRGLGRGWRRAGGSLSVGSGAPGGRTGRAPAVSGRPVVHRSRTRIVKTGFARRTCGGVTALASPSLPSLPRPPCGRADSRVRGPARRAFVTRRGVAGGTKRGFAASGGEPIHRFVARLARAQPTTARRRDPDGVRTWSSRAASTRASSAFSSRSRSIIFTACMTVVWSRPPK